MAEQEFFFIFISNFRSDGCNKDIPDDFDGKGAIFLEDQRAGERHGHQGGHENALRKEDADSNDDDDNNGNGSQPLRGFPAVALLLGALLTWIM